MFLISLQSLAEMCSCGRGLSCKERSQNDWTVWYFLEIKGFWEHFETTKWGTGTSQYRSGHLVKEVEKEDWLQAGQLKPKAL
jgi:hypothetical protein